MAGPGALAPYPEAGPVDQPGEIRVVRLEARKGLASLGLRDLISNHELIQFLVWRDIKVRYKQTALGAAWAILQPVLTMVVFSMFFGRLAKLPSDGVPYPIFAFAALLPWNMFANGLTGSAGSLVASSALLKKVYLPRLAIPIAAVLAVVVDFAIAFLVLLCMMAAYRIAPTPAALLVIPFTLLAIVASLGAGIWLAALNVKYRDVKYVLPFLTQLWMFATPVAYSSSLIKNDAAKIVFALNPMVAVVDGFRYALLGAPAPGLATVATSTAMALVILAIGVTYFRQSERTFADVI